MLFCFGRDTFRMVLFAVLEEQMDNELWSLNRETISKLLRGIEENGGKIVRKDGEPCFVLHSGMHTRVKYDFERVFQYFGIRNLLASAFVEFLFGCMTDPPRVLIRRPLWSQYSVLKDSSRVVYVGDVSIGSFLSTMQDVAPYFVRASRMALAKKKDGAFVFDKNCDFRENDRILLVDDVLTTGKTLVALADALCRWYAEHFSCAPRIIGSAVLLDRSSALIPPPSALDFVPRPLFSLMQDSDSKIYNAPECPYHAK